MYYRPRETLGFNLALWVLLMWNLWQGSLCFHFLTCKIGLTGCGSWHIESVSQHWPSSSVLWLLLLLCHHVLHSLMPVFTLRLAALFLGSSTDGALVDGLRDVRDSSLRTTYPRESVFGNDNSCDSFGGKERPGNVTPYPHCSRACACRMDLSG